MKKHIKTRRKIKDPSFDSNWVNWVDHGPNALKVFNELKVEGTCRVCREHEVEVNPYIRECFPCTQSPERRKRFQWRD